MNTYTIIVERISTGERAPSLVTRQTTEQAARDYAETAIKTTGTPGDLRIVEIIRRS